MENDKITTEEKTPSKPLTSDDLLRIIRNISITPPMFAVKDPMGNIHTLNEYEFQTLRAEIAERKIAGFSVQSRGWEPIDEKGRMENPPNQMNVLSDILRRIIVA